MTHPWSDMKWWNSGERQVVEEKIDDLTARGITCNPSKKSLYRALSLTPERTVRVVVVGQDPYPTAGQADGLAFSISSEISQERWPHTLKIIFREYSSDLGLPIPSHGDLSQWAGRGVLLWNAVPSVQSGHPLSNDWDEWRYLTGEIIDRLAETGGIVFVFLGLVAQRYADKIDQTRNRVIKTSHPSPRGNRSSRTPFSGSRVFSEINRHLVELKKDKIDWELKDVDSSGKGDGEHPKLGGGNVLPNITGAELGGLKRQGTSPNIYTSFAF